MRKPKPPVSAWIVEQRKRLGWKSEELAARLDVSESTVRGWESGRSVSPDNLTRLEFQFGVEAPGRDAPAADQAAVVAAIDRQTEVMQALVDELRATREDRDRIAALERAVQVLSGQVAAAAVEALPVPRAPRTTAG